MDAYVGDYYWTHGPLLIAPPNLRSEIERSIDDGTKSTLRGAVGAPIVPVEVRGMRVWVLPGAEHTAVHRIDEGCAVLVRRKGYAHPVLELPELMRYDPGWARGTWQPTGVTLEVGHDGLLVFDTNSGADSAEAERAREALRLPLDPGAYEVDTIEREPHGKRFAVSLLRLRRPGHAGAILAKEAPGTPAPLQATPEILSAAERLHFASTQGGPFLFAPARLRTAWWGVNNKAGETVYDAEPTHYDRACEVGDDIEPIEVGDGNAFALGSPAATAFHAIEDGALLLRWLGADSAAAVLASVLFAPVEWQDTGLTLESDGGEWLLFDSAADGRNLEGEDVLRVDLPAGHYRVERMDAWRGEVLVNGAPQDTLSAAYRLRWLGALAKAAPKKAAKAAPKKAAKAAPKKAAKAAPKKAAKAAPKKAAKAAPKKAAKAAPKKAAKAAPKKAAKAAPKKAAKAAPKKARKRGL